MHRGWFKCWRKIIDSSVWQNPELLKLWIWCLAKANWEACEAHITAGREVYTVQLKPGQFLFGRHTAAAELGWTASSTRNRMLKLKTLGNVDIKADKRYSVVTICNWETYATDENDGGQQRGHGPDTDLTRGGHGEDTEKKVKKPKKTKKKGSSIAYSDDFERFWQAFPSGRRAKKAIAFASFEKALDNGQDAEYLIRRAGDYAASGKGRSEFVQMPATWLNGACWDDAPEAWKNKNGKPEPEEEPRKYIN